MDGREKGFLKVGGAPILSRIAKILASQCSTMMISAAGDPSRFAPFDAQVIVDQQCRGPMSGLADVLEWCAGSDLGITHILSVPSDTPFLPDDLGARLAAALEPDMFACCAASGGRLHPIVGLWPLAARHAMHEAIARNALSFHAVLEGKPFAKVEWQTEPRDPFFNINTPEDLAFAELI